jgi:hypothetical protein
MSDHLPPTDPPSLPHDFEAALAAYSAREQGRSLAPSPDFAARVSAVAVSRLRWVRRGWWATVAAAILSLGVGTYITVRHFTAEVPVVVNEPPLIPMGDPYPPPKLGDSFSEAGEALASLSQDAMGKTVESTKALFAGADKFRFTPPKAIEADVQPAANTFERVPSAAKSSLEPLTTHTRRAIGLFLRDTGLQSNP